MRLVLLHIQCPIYKLEKGGKGAHDIFRRGGCDPLLFQKGGIFPTTNKTLKGHSYHLIFHIKRLSGVIGGYAIIKTGRRKNGLTFSVYK